MADAARISPPQRVIVDPFHSDDESGSSITPTDVHDPPLNAISKNDKEWTIVPLRRRQAWGT